MTDPVQSPHKTPFTVRDSLGLEVFNVFSQPRIAVHGEIVAYARTDRYHESSGDDIIFHFAKGSTVFVRFPGDSAPLPLTADTDSSWSPTWSPDGSKVAFYAFRKGVLSIGIWNRETRSSAYHAVKECFGRGPLKWNPDGRIIYFFSNSYSREGVLKPYEADEDPIVRMTSQEVDPFDARYISFAASRITAFDIEAKSFDPVTPDEITIMSYELSPDGKWIAVLEIIKHKIRVPVPAVNRLLLIDQRTGDCRVVISDTEMTQFSWSPDSLDLAYVDNGRLSVYSVAEEKTTYLSNPDIKIGGKPVWRPEKRSILCSVGDKLCLFDVASKAHRLIDTGIPYSIQQYLWDDSGKSIYLKVVDPESGQQGIYRYNPGKATGEELLLEDRMVQVVGLENDSFYLTLQSAQEPENVWRLGLTYGTKDKITDLNPQAAKKIFGRTELVSYTSRRGENLQGVFLFPVEYEAGKSYPVIFWVYETFSHQLHYFYHHLYNLQILANNGYGVFLPDVIFETGEAADSYVQAVEPAMERLVELGFAGGKFGVMGHSFGGYAANVLMTKSKRFQAGIAIAGISDWIGFHGVPGDYMRLSNERGQGRLGGDLRTYPERYVKNSPVFFIHQVEAPHMLIHGTADQGVPFSQAEEMYYGLRHLKKEAVLIGYPGERHLYWGTKIRVIEDMWRRILDWFDSRLK